MKLTLSTLACPTWTLPQIAEAASAAGIEGLDFRGLGPEIDVTRLPEFNERLDETLHLLRRYGLQVPCLNTSVTLVTPAADRWQMMLEEAQRTARLAERTRTRFLRVFGGVVPKEMQREEAAMLARRHLRQLVKVCGQYGCGVLLETHDDWSTSGQAMEIVHEFDPDEVGVLWDVEHPFRHGEPPGDTVPGIRRHLRHVHFKDSARGQGRYTPRLLGAGDLPLKEIYAALRQAGYEGWICLETEKRWHESAPDPEQSIPQFAEYMRTLSVEF